MSVADFAAIEAALIHAGLTPRGGFHPSPDDGVPALPGGRPTATLVLAGNVGSGLWRVFSQQRQAADEPNPLDRWTRRVLTPLAEASSIPLSTIRVLSSEELL